MDTEGFDLLNEPDIFMYFDVFYCDVNFLKIFGNGGDGGGLKAIAFAIAVSSSTLRWTDTIFLMYFYIESVTFVGRIRYYYSCT